MKKTEVLLSKKPKKWIINLVFFVLLMVALIVSFNGSKINMTRLKTIGNSINVMLDGFTKINIDVLLGIGTRHFQQGVVYLALQTLAIAFIGTLLGAILAIPFSFLASKRVVGNTFSKVGIVILVFIRVFPPIILVIVFVSGFGMTPLAVMLAVGLHSIGMLGKIFSESIDSMETGPIEALDATGANTLQKLRYGILPQIVPDLTSITLYRFDINVRSASILGVVGTGAGGFGPLLLLASYSSSWELIDTILVVVIVLVLLVDFVSSYLRKKLV